MAQSASNGLFGEGSADGNAWAEARKAELWDGEVEKVIAALHSEADKPRGQAAADEIHYFETNRDRMRYDLYRKQGYPIGSGTVESACKRLIGARLKQAGMCWTKQGAQTVLSLRAALLSKRCQRQRLGAYSPQQESRLNLGVHPLFIRNLTALECPVTIALGVADVSQRCSGRIPLRTDPYTVWR